MLVLVTGPMISNVDSGVAHSAIVKLKSFDGKTNVPLKPEPEMVIDAELCHSASSKLQTPVERALATMEMYGTACMSRPVNAPGPLRYWPLPPVMLICA